VATSLLFPVIQQAIGIINSVNRKAFNTRRDGQMMYVDSRYISVARKSELLQHERTMNQLRRQVAQLSKAVAWELEQHQSRLKELQRVEDTLGEEGQPALSPPTQPTLEPVPSSTRKWTKFRKYAHRSLQKSVAELVG
jgi:superfamily II RNA helicase